MVLMLGLVAGCKEDAPPASAPPTPTNKAPAVPEELDAGDAGMSSAVTSAAPEVEEATSAADAAPDARPPKAPKPKADASLDAGKSSDAGDAGDGGRSDAGDAGDHGHEVGLCSSLGSEGPSEPGLCEDEGEDWCESPAVVAACEEFATSRDEGVFAAYLDCLDEVFEDPDLCDRDETARLAVAADCEKTADATACGAHAIQCEVYEGCEGYTVAQCDADTARFNEQYLTYGAPYFECPTPASIALGE